ncbi:MAG: PorP/SprF family type IX secretion system membrane protein [Bacteroidales bacterium]|nr:PorP/SprF family type IX secretion system membrane protein [Bacteroidales bacterium]
MFKKTLFVILLGLLSVCSWAQQEPYAMHYMHNLISVNPGYAGARDAISATAIIHNQWAGFRDEVDPNQLPPGADPNSLEQKGAKLSPNTNYITIDAPINLIHGGLGLSIIQDNAGYGSMVNVNLAYAYRTSLLGGDLGIGVQAGLLNHGNDFGKIIWHTEESIESGEQTDMLFDLGGGIYWEIPEQFYMGVSSSRLLENRGKRTLYSDARHYFFNAGYHYILPNRPEFMLSPSVMVVYDGATINPFVGSMLTYKGKFTGGLSYSLNNDLGVHVGVYWKNFMFGYAYGITTSKLASFGGTHEVIVNYSFKLELEKIRKRYKNVRYL